MTRNDELLARRREVVPKGVAHTVPVFIATAEGSLLTDVDGREIIDFAGGLGVLNIGHGHPKVVEAIRDQAGRCVHTCLQVALTEPYVELAEKLCAITPGDFPKMALFLSSGAEAVENAVKIARYATGRPAIVTFENAFHGRTLLTMSLTSKAKPYKYGFGPFAPEIYRIPFGEADRFEDLLINHVAPESIAAVIAEPVQGEGGFLTPPPDFFPRLADLCRANGILFIDDEIQSGMGRTGRMFAIEHWKVVPDLLVCAKSLAAGLPLSAVVGRREIMDAPHVGGLGGTFAGNPVACRAALTVLDIFEEERLLDRALTLGEKLERRLKTWKRDFRVVGELRGIGAMRAFELVEPTAEGPRPSKKLAGRLIEICLERGLLVLTCGAHGNTIRMLMPLTIPDNLLERGLATIEDSLRLLDSWSRDRDHD
jgi:4-aminobutyrate aminotransferase / (S)-3-amino-2-methylpropionate transaminase / 5-aminovalerate transaminase